MFGEFIVFTKSTSKIARADHANLNWDGDQANYVLRAGPYFINEFRSG